MRDKNEIFILINHCWTIYVVCNALKILLQHKFETIYLSSWDNFKFEFLGSIGSETWLIHSLM